MLLSRNHCHKTMQQSSKQAKESSSNHQSSTKKFKPTLAPPSVEPPQFHAETCASVATMAEELLEFTKTSSLHKDNKKGPSAKVNLRALLQVLADRARDAEVQAWRLAVKK